MQRVGERNGTAPLCTVPMGAHSKRIDAERLYRVRGALCTSKEEAGDVSQNISRSKLLEKPCALHPLDDGLAEAGAGHFRDVLATLRLHQAGEVICHARILDSLPHPAQDQVGRLRPAHVLQHHHG